MDDDKYQSVKAAARRWLDRSRHPEYAAEKQERQRIRFAIGVLRRKARLDNDYEAIALLNICEAYLLSHKARVKAALR